MPSTIPVPLQRETSSDLSQLLYSSTPLLPLISKLLLPHGSVISATEVCGPYSPLSSWALQTLLLTCNPAQR